MLSIIAETCGLAGGGCQCLVIAGRPQTAQRRPRLSIAPDISIIRIDIPTLPVAGRPGGAAGIIARMTQSEYVLRMAASDGPVLYS